MYKMYINGVKNAEIQGCVSRIRSERKRNTMELKQLNYFMVCAKTGSFSNAAEVLFTTQSSVSKVIKSLEDELGTKLFERYARGIRLTETGRKIYPYAVRISESFQEISLICGQCSGTDNSKENEISGV